MSVRQAQDGAFSNVMGIVKNEFDSLLDGVKVTQTVDEKTQQIITTVSINEPDPVKILGADAINPDELPAPAWQKGS